MKKVTEYINNAHLDNTTIGSNGVEFNPGNPLTPSINFSSAYAFKSVDDLLKYHDNKYNSIRYTRDGSEIVFQVESYFRQMFSTFNCLLFESGMSAISSAISSVVVKGHKVITFGNIYRKTKKILEEYELLGVVESVNYKSYRDFLNDSIVDKNIIFFIESPSNPFLRLANIRDIRKRYPKAIIVLDFTLQALLNEKNTFKYADIIVTSCTKYISGHNDLIGGLVVINTNKFFDKVWLYRSSHGGKLDENSSFLLLRSLRTYDMRISVIVENTKKVLEYIENQKNIVRIYYPGSYENSDQHKMFLNDYYHGGGVITIEVSENVNIRRNIENLRSIKMAPSFGSVDSLIEIPLYMSYWGNSDNDLQLLGISDRLVRISIGCEPIKYILSDIKRLLKV